MTTTAIKKPARKAGKSGRKKADTPFRLPDQSEWTFELIEQIHDEIRRVAEGFGLDTYPN